MISAYCTDSGPMSQYNLKRLFISNFSNIPSGALLLLAILVRQRTPFFSVVLKLIRVIKTEWTRLNLETDLVFDPVAR